MIKFPEAFPSFSEQRMQMFVQGGRMLDQVDDKADIDFSNPKARYEFAKTIIQADPDDKIFGLSDHAALKFFRVVKNFFAFFKADSAPVRFFQQMFSDRVASVVKRVLPEPESDYESLGGSHSGSSSPRRAQSPGVGSTDGSVSGSDYESEEDAEYDEVPVSARAPAFDLPEHLPLPGIATDVSFRGPPTTLRVRRVRPAPEMQFPANLILPGARVATSFT